MEDPLRDVPRWYTASTLVDDLGGLRRQRVTAGAEFTAAVRGRSACTREHGFPYPPPQEARGAVLGRQARPGPGDPYRCPGGPVRRRQRPRPTSPRAWTATMTVDCGRSTAPPWSGWIGCTPPRSRARPAGGRPCRTAGRAHVTVSTATSHCDRLARSGLLRRLRHGREVRLCLTDDGAALLDLPA
ncbi:hypothetical protein ACPB9J_09310 [Streptomyces lavendulocolor]|uniref:hypothetical protein n=1 Tax=Streptomyces lavendulocolor TaxID=67316 RepID=UPI003C2F440F